MSDGLLEGFRILALIVLVWFGLVGWKLVPRRRAHAPRALGPNSGGR
jgi:hypothetical protein